MEIDGVEYPDHVVAAFMELHGKTDKLNFPLYWFEQHIITFNQGWKYGMEPKPKITGIRDNVSGISYKLHAELERWLKRMKESGSHPTVEELQRMVTMANISKRTIAQIRDAIEYEEL